jgi:hypothetical protein
MDREELAWAAGFFDGEGCTCISHRHPPYKSIAITISQAGSWVETPEVFRRLKRLFPFANLSGPYKHGSVKPQHMCTIYGFKNVQAAIAMLWTFLSEPKKVQAKAALDEIKEYYHVQ